MVNAALTVACRSATTCGAPALPTRTWIALDHGDRVGCWAGEKEYKVEFGQRELASLDALKTEVGGCEQFVRA